MRIHRSIIAIGLAGALGAAAAPAQADHRDNVIRFGDANFGIHLRFDDDRHGRHYGRRGHHSDRLPPRRIRRILHRRGFHDISRIDYRPRPDVYVVRAENRRGRDVRVRVDADTGHILNVNRLGPRHGRRGPGRRFDRR